MSLANYRAKRTQNKKNAILIAARLEFSTKGFEKTQMAEIAKAADVSTATLYKHFLSKENLLSLLLEGDDTDFQEGDTKALALHLALAPLNNAFVDPYSPGYKEFIAVKKLLLES